MNTPASSRSFLDYVPRIGYFARGIVYTLIGVLAVMVAFGEGGQVEGSQGTLQWLQQAPYDNVILGLMALGLLAYALWRLAQAFVDPEDEADDDAKGFLSRAKAFAVGILHLGLAFYAGSLAIGSGGGGGSSSSWSGELMQTDVGPYLIGAFAIAVAIAGLMQFYKAYSSDFLHKLKTGEMSAQTQDFVKKIGRAGMVARGIVFLIIAWFLVDAAMDTSAAEAAQAGLGSALDTIAAQPYGTILLFLVAVGLACYGVYSMVKGYYRRLAF